MLQVLSFMDTSMVDSPSLVFNRKWQENMEDLCNTLDIMIAKTGEKEGRHVKILAKLDLSKPLMRGTMLKHKQSEFWILFKYEQLPIFYYYCGCIGHNERGCTKRNEDLN